MLDFHAKSSAFCTQKLRLDFVAQWPLRVTMDENESELLRLIYTRIGMTMEDASVVALTLGGPRSTFDPEPIAELRKAVDAIAALLGAAEALRE